MESYYSSDEEIAWGPVTLREIKGDLKRPVLRKPKRRHTVFGNLQKEPEQITEPEQSTELYTENMPHLHEEVASKLNISGASTAYYTPNESLRTGSNVDFLEKLSKVINEPQSDMSEYVSALDNTKSSVSTNNISLLLDNETCYADNRSTLTNTGQENVSYNLKTTTENIATPYLFVTDGNKSNLNDTCYNFVKAVAQRNTQYDIANFHQTLVDNSLVVSEDEEKVDENQYSNNDHSINEVNLGNKRTSTIQEEEEEEEGEEEDEEEEVVVIISDEESILIMDDSLDESCAKSFKKERESESLMSSRVHLSYSLISTDSDQDEPNDWDKDDLRNNMSKQNLYEYINPSDEVDVQAEVSKANCDNIDNHVEKERLILGEQNEVQPISNLCPQKLFSEHEYIHCEGGQANNYLLIGEKGYTENSRLLTPIENKLSMSTSPIEVPEFDLAQFDSNDDSLKLDDTMEAINRLLEQGANSAVSTEKKEVIEPTPTKSNPKTGFSFKQSRIISSPFSQKLQPLNLPSDKEQVTKIPLRNTPTHPTSAEKTQIKRPKQKLPSPAQFRIPEVPHKPKLTHPTPPKTCHSSLKNVVSPVALYIKNSPRVTLKKNIPHKELTHIVKTNTPKVSNKENLCDFPEVVYKPSKRQITTKEKEIILPPSLKKLNVKEPVITKHEGRIRQKLEKVSVNRNVLENDITNNSIDGSLLNNSSDISVLTKKQAYIK